jgi:hypothetical protein
MAGSPFNDDEDPEETNGAAFAALLRALPVTGQVNLPNGGQIDSTGGLMPWERSAPEPAAAERGMEADPAPVFKEPFYESPSYAPAAQAAPTGVDDVNGYAPITAPAPVKLKPYGDYSADRQALTDQKTRESQENVKPSVGRKILAGVSAFMGGAGARDPRVGAEIGQNIMHAPLRRAEERWALQEAPLKQRLVNDQAQDLQTRQQNLDTEAQGRVDESNYRNQIIGRFDQARGANQDAQAAARRNAPIGFIPDDMANPYAGGTVTTADGRKLKGQPPPDKWLTNWERDPRNQATIGVLRLKALKDQGISLNPEQTAIVGTGGRLTPTTHTTISVLENPDGSARLPAGRGGPKNPDENVEGIVAKATQDKQAFADQWHRVDGQHADALAPEGSYLGFDGSKGISAAEFQSRIEKFRTDANVKLAKYGARIDEKGNVQRGNAPAAQAAPATGNWREAPQPGEQPAASARPGPAAQSAQPDAAPALPAPVAAAPKGNDQPATPAPSKPAPATPAAAQGKSQTFTIKGRQLTVGDPIMVDGKQVIFKGVNPQTHRIIYGQ